MTAAVGGPSWGDHLVVMHRQGLRVVGSRGAPSRTDKLTKANSTQPSNGFISTGEHGCGGDEADDDEDGIVARTTPINMASLASSGTRHRQCRGRSYVTYVAAVATWSRRRRQRRQNVGAVVGGQWQWCSHCHDDDELLLRLSLRRR